MSMLAEILEKKSNLRPTVTVVRPHPTICAGLEKNGLDCLGGSIEDEEAEEQHLTVEYAKQCANALRASSHAVVYTGAGVSTSTGISDYRGPNGVWTCLATGRIPDDSFDVTAAQPSYTHMCIKKLIDTGLVKFCTSTNLDGLHLKSGLTPLDNLAELHGNMWVERCTRCRKETQRPFPIRRTATRMTGRWCTCGGSYMDSGIDFGQPLPMKHLGAAEQQARSSDFALVFGTSMRVNPAASLPLSGPGVAEDGPEGVAPAQLCIVNMMSTPYDDRCLVRSYSKCDEFCFHLMNELGLEPDLPPPSRLFSAFQMKKRAQKHMPEYNGAYVGSAVKEQDMAIALSRTEAEIVAQLAGLSEEERKDGS